MCCCLFLPSVLLALTIFKYINVEWIYIYNCHIFLMNWLPYYIMIFFTPLVSILNYSPFCLIYSYPCLLVFHLHGKSFSIFLHLLMCVLIAEVNLLWAAYNWVLFFYLFMKQLCPLIRKFSSFAIRLIMDRQGPTNSNLLIVIFLFLFLLSFVNLWFFIVVCFDSLLFIICESTAGFCLWLLWNLHKIYV